MRRMVFAAAVMALGLAAPAWAQNSTDPAAQRNVRESEQYDQLACRNAKFRATRIAKECGPLKGSELYDGCVASFDCGKGAPPVNPKGPPSTERIH